MSCISVLRYRGTLSSICLSTALAVAGILPATASGASLASANLAVPDAVQEGVSVASPPDFPVLVDVRAAHHRGFDRIVFEFEGPLPDRTVARWVDQVSEDASGRPLPVSGNAFISVVLSPVVAHTSLPPVRTTYGARERAFDLPNLTQLMAAGDYEAVVSFGLGLMKRTEILRTVRLRHPSRFVIDVSTAFPTVPVGVVFVDREALDAGTPPYLAVVERLVPRSGRPMSALQRLWAGVTRDEQAAGLRFVSSGTTAFRRLDIDGPTGIARLRIVGGCDDRNKPVTVADEIMATLRGFERIDWVKIYRGDETQHPHGLRDSVPECLAP
jgi:hypothetical protein